MVFLDSKYFCCLFYLLSLILLKLSENQFLVLLIEHFLLFLVIAVISAMIDPVLGRDVDFELSKEDRKHQVLAMWQ